MSCYSNDCQEGKIQSLFNLNSVNKCQIPTFKETRKSVISVSVKTKIKLAYSGLVLKQLSLQEYQ